MRDAPTALILKCALGRAIDDLCGVFVKQLEDIFVTVIQRYSQNLGKLKFTETYSPGSPSAR
jgi:hypothetical protein